MTVDLVLDREPDVFGPFVAADVLGAADVRLARRLGRTGGDEHPEVLLAAALALRAPRFGHVCVELDRVADRAGDGHAGLVWPEPEPWRQRLVDSPLVRAGGPGGTPLVLDGHALYLDRYWGYEQRLARALTERAARRVEDVDRAGSAVRLDELFGPGGAGGLDRQRLAAAMALLRRLTVIAGGPGTGKTHTVTRILALLQMDALARAPGRPLRAALAAPTGKAAARLQDALTEGLDRLRLDGAVRDALARTPALTLHRLLGTRRDSASRFRHHAGDPLPHDVVIVDEASMVSLPLMAKLADAVAEDARLVLLGDRDQLASVEAGVAFGDICGPAGSRPVLRLSREAIAEAEPLVGAGLHREVEVAERPGVWDTVVRLSAFRRFGPDSPLAAVASAVQREDTSPGGTVSLLRSGRSHGSGAGVRLLDPDDAPGVAEACRDEVVTAYAHYADLALAEDPDPMAVLGALDRIRVLCALRRGPQGSRAWNAAIEERLTRQVPGFRTDRPWYPGRPVLVTENDHSLRLYNGDVGVIVRDPAHRDRSVALFRAPDGSLRRLSPARLPACETTFAMTVHKSQGSQFGHAVVVLPEVPSEVLTRELVYTALTRATHRTTLLAREEVLARAIARPVQRATGLQHRLWGT